MARSAIPDPSADPKTAKLWEMIREIDIAMMTTLDGGHLRARPMWCLQDKFDGALYFFTKASSHKVEEVREDSHIGLAYAKPNSQDYVSVSGRGRLVRDRALVKELWKEPMRTWFPEGTDDPDIAVLAVDVELAEYWDSPSSTMVHLYGYAKAALTGEPPHPGDNEKLDFRGRA